MGFPQPGDKLVPVHITEEDPSPLDAAANDVVKRTGNVNFGVGVAWKKIAT